MSNNLYIETKGAISWKDFLAEPDKQWKTGYSAKSLAYSWESEKGFPMTIQKSFKKSKLDLEMLLGIPEYKVFLDTKKAPSQNDLFVLAKDKFGLATIMVEGKVLESFDRYIGYFGEADPHSGDIDPPSQKMVQRTDSMTILHLFS
ncbi:MAG: hypothetical protein J7L95_06695 [Prolixibacteraceae bacterium]|nr:hypothetical protein [Prolixibacteraceae bacterium]